MSRLEYMRNYRQKTSKLCPICNKNSILKESSMCRECHFAGKMLVDDTRTIQELMYTQHHKSSAFSLIRGRARTVYKGNVCENCGYDKHTEVCHMKAIRDFSLDTPINIVNHPTNLIRLCPNCHWEYDNGMLLL